MSLFPAYEDTSECRNDCKAEASTESLALETQLLASDEEEGASSKAAASGSSPAAAGPPVQDEYYEDCKLDVGNLRVSTLYYPGRPQYESLAPRMALGDDGAARRGDGAARRVRRYYAVPAPADELRADTELLQRIRAFRDMLAENPTDEAMWLQFIEFQERWVSADAALSAASEAAARLGESRRVRAALHRARAAALPPHRHLDLIREDLAKINAGGGGGAALMELWLRALGVAGAVGEAELTAAAGAALAATRAAPAAYPHILYAYGGYLRAAGLWERLVLLLELVTSMNFPPVAFPPRVDPGRLVEQERKLQDFEDKVTSCGLPLSTVWVRVERARAATHWRPPGPGAPAAPVAPDPQRAPLAADVAELLLPAADADAAGLLLVHVLRLAKMPLMPFSEYALAAVDASNDALGDAYELDGAEALLALLRAARRLPPAHPARAPPGVAARLVAPLLDPPHYFTDDAGYLTWVTSLWDACCEWSAGEWRVALLCWRLRWLQSMLLLLDGDDAARREARRVRGVARDALRRFAGASPLPYAQWARVEAAAGDAAAARRAALHAWRAALRDPACAPHQRLYVARVVSELSSEACGAWATVCAALQRAPPDDHELGAPPPAELLREALRCCEEQCAALEAALEGAAGPARALDALLPAPGEWAAARARLAGGARRAELLRALAAAAPAAEGGARRYWEHAACALVLAAARDHRLAQTARAVAPLFPHNALLALCSSGAPLWAWEQRGTHAQRLRALTGAARSHRAALAAALPALLRATAVAWRGPLCARAAAACARAARGGAGGALLHAARMEAAARAAGRAPAALLAALDRHPQYKWLAVRGAAARGADAAALADVLLERQLRAHALYDELTVAAHAPR